MDTFINKLRNKTLKSNDLNIVTRCLVQIDFFFQAGGVVIGSQVGFGVVFSGPQVGAGVGVVVAGSSVGFGVVIGSQVGAGVGVVFSGSQVGAGVVFSGSYSMFSLGPALDSATDSGADPLS